MQSLGYALDAPQQCPSNLGRSRVWLATYRGLNWSSFRQAGSGATDLILWLDGGLGIGDLNVISIRYFIAKTLIVLFF